MSTLEGVRKVLASTLQLGSRIDTLKEDSRLLGGIPEFDSMAVVALVTMLEDEFGMTIDDDELSAEVFESLGSLCRFIDGKLQG